MMSKIGVHAQNDTASILWHQISYFYFMLSHMQLNSILKMLYSHIFTLHFF